MPKQTHNYIKSQRSFQWKIYYPNRLEQAVNGKGETALYTYNGLGHRVGKTTGTMKAPEENHKVLRGMAVTEPLSILEEQVIRPEKKIEYTIDLTRQYHNLLQKEEGENTQSYLWDGNVVGMMEGGHESCYFQDEMGSTIRLMDKNGELEESYGYDEFGQDLYGNQGMVQPFGDTGYQSDRVIGTYYAQAREYRAELGRFVAIDIVKGFIAAPYTLNEYGYCWNNPEKYVDLNGKEPTQTTEPDTYTYDRDAAIEYAEKWSNAKQGMNSGFEAFLGKIGIGRNSDYYSYSTNCANFVSQCLYAGGIQQNDSWHSRKSEQIWMSGSGNHYAVYYEYDVAPVWRLAQDQFDYFSDVENGYANGDYITIKSADEIEEKVNDNNIQKGDLMYFIDEEGNVHHAAIISNIVDGQILYSGNTKRRYNYPLSEALRTGKYDGVYIVRIKDELSYEGSNCNG